MPFRRLALGTLVTGGALLIVPTGYSLSPAPPPVPASATQVHPDTMAYLAARAADNDATFHVQNDAIYLTMLTPWYFFDDFVLTSDDGATLHARIHNIESAAIGGNRILLEVDDPDQSFDDGAWTLTVRLTPDDEDAEANRRQDAPTLTLPVFNAGTVEAPEQPLKTHFSDWRKSFSVMTQYASGDALVVTLTHVLATVADTWRDGDFLLAPDVPYIVETKRKGEDAYTTLSIVHGSADYVALLGANGTAKSTDWLDHPAQDYRIWPAGAPPNAAGTASVNYQKNTDGIRRMERRNDGCSASNAPNGSVPAALLASATVIGFLVARRRAHA